MLPPRKPWWQSLTIIGVAIVAIAAKLLPLIAPRWTPVAQPIAEAAGAIVAAIGHRRALTSGVQIS